MCCGGYHAQISAKKGDGVDELLETVLLQAEVEELMVGRTLCFVLVSSLMFIPSSSPSLWNMS